MDLNHMLMQTQWQRRQRHQVTAAVKALENAQGLAI